MARSHKSLQAFACKDLSMTNSSPYMLLDWFNFIWIQLLTVIVMNLILMIIITIWKPLFNYKILLIDFTDMALWSLWSHDFFGDLFIDLRFLLWSLSDMLNLWQFIYVFLLTISISLVDVTMMDLWKIKIWWWWWCNTNSFKQHLITGRTATILLKILSAAKIVYPKENGTLFH